MNLYTLNYNNSLYSVYNNNKSIIITSYNKRNIQTLKKILNNRYNVSKTWIKNVESINMFSEDNVEIKLSENNFCNLDDNYEKELDIAYLQTKNKNDLQLIYQFTNLMNISVFVVREIKYNENCPLLSINGFYDEYIPDNKELEINFPEYLNALYDINN